MYTVLDKNGAFGRPGEEHTLFASKALHSRIQDTRAGKDDTISIIKVGEGKDTRWDVQKVEDLDEATGHPKPLNHGQEAFHQDLRRYSVAWDMAHDFLTEKGQTGDLNAIAFTFYKMAKDARHDLLQEKEGGDSGNA